MKPIAIGLLLACGSLAGCATQKGAYDWGNYDELLYRNYKDASRAEEYRIGLETHIAALEKAHGRVPPGLYAELGTAYLQAGDRDRAVELYARERDAWPESKGLMDVMISSLERRSASASEVQ